ncbi:MAG: sigma-54-dependent Fis family transcriptional regulator, partial [Candidatus Krumholzibacteriota bacterium]|nr:sigma-54-dependent Fis family transcriptional regulator [Candidatus Krumholzibacteriota bacterium]
MPIEIQPKILRALQEREISRVGEEERTRKVNVRILAATHTDLSRAVDEGRFREDLFFRLNAAQISLIPLRERREDIVPLAEHFLKMYAEEKRQPLALLGRDARELFMNHDWKGNVRELKSAVEWGIVFQDDHHVIHASALAQFFERSGGTVELPPERMGTLKSMMGTYEEKLIRRVLQENNNTITVSARALGISRQQLHSKIRKYEIKVSKD